MIVKKLSGRVEVDAFFIGGKSSGKRGRGSENKTIVAMAVEDETLKNRWGAFDFTLHWTVPAYSLETFILDNIEPGATIATDSWSGYNSIDKEQFGHEKTNQHKKGDYENLYGVYLVTTLIKRLVRGPFMAGLNRNIFKTILMNMPSGLTAENQKASVKSLCVSSSRP